jgi:hypothetical protein
MGVCDVTLNVWKYHGVSDYYGDEEPYYAAERVIDDFTSLVWCERYMKPGEFVLTMNATPENVAFFTGEKNLIISRAETDRAMFVESVDVTTHPKNGDILKLKGNSIENVLNSRCILQSNTLSGKPDDLIYYFIDWNIGNYYYNGLPPSRLWSKVRLINILGIDDHENLNLNQTKTQPYYQKVGDFTFDLCKAFKFGFKIRFVNGLMKYSCYRGKNRTVNQSENNSVIFADEFGNLGKTEYSVNNTTYYNSIVVAGEGNGNQRVSQRVGYIKSLGGIALKEKYVDKKNISSLSDGLDDYNRLLGKIANAELDASTPTIELIGEAVPGGQYEYRKDYDLGDIVTVKTNYGMTGSATVSEVVETVDSSGYKSIPTFTEWRVDNA